MSKIKKEIERLKSRPKDFTYDEAKRVLNNFGFIENNKGKTSGSRVKFIDGQNRIIELHKPLLPDSFWKKEKIEKKHQLW